MRNLVFFFISVLHAQLCYFIPPEGWEMAEMKNPSPHIQIALLGKGSTGFRPSMNLAIEETDASFKDYIKAVKELHSQDPSANLRDLGMFEMRGGKGRLLELSNSSGWGEIQMLQAILVKDSKAYILTSAVLKSEFSKFQKDLFSSLKSLNVIKDLWDPIKESKRQSEFKGLFSSLNAQEWPKFCEQVVSMKELGSYWQYLALKEGRKQLQ